jgi:hypothetical protein
MLFNCFTALLVLVQLAGATTLPLRIVSFNIRYAASSLETNEVSWWTLFCFIWPSQCRQPHSISHLSAIAANATLSATTVFGLQEALDNQLNDLLDGLGSEWTHIGVARDDGAKSGEYSPILYRSDVLDVVYSETKWLSVS